LGRLISALMLVFLPVQTAFSFTIIDVDLFYAFYEKPKKVIDFTEFKDGTPIVKISGGFQLNAIYKAKLDCLVSDKSDESSFGGLEGIAVQPDAFSDDWSFMVVNPKKPDSFCKAVIWFDQGIASGNLNIAVIAASGHSKPFVLYTNKGFLGIVPDSPDETVFIFDNISIVFIFETDFPRPSSVSDQEDTILAELK
jgi:hypothetical protein